MKFTDDIALWVGGLAVAGLLCQFVLHLRSPETRARRKRRRNYGKVVTKSRRPAVMLNVNERSE